MNNFLLKLKEVLGSNNFRVSVFSLVALLLSYNGIEIDKTPQEISDLFTNQNFIGVLLTLVMNFLNPVFKLVQKIISKTWSWDFFQSENFRTQLLTIVTIILGVVSNQYLVSVLIAATIQLINWVGHLLSKPKQVA